MTNLITRLPRSDVTPRAFFKKGGAVAPPRARTAVVVSADPAVRSDWARYFEALGMRTLRCAGPQVLCTLLDGGHCPLHEEADLAIYDRASVTPELTLKLVRASRSLPIAFAKDRLDADDHHEPLITSLASQGRADDTCIGLSAEKLAR